MPDLENLKSLKSSSVGEPIDAESDETRGGHIAEKLAKLCPGVTHFCSFGTVSWFRHEAAPTRKYG